MATIPEALALAVEHHQAGRLDVAEQIYRQILAVEPNQPDALHLLGVLAHQLGQHDMAVQLIERAIELKGADAALCSSLGNALLAQGKPAEAAACFRRAVELKPDSAEAYNNLGNTLRAQGKLDEAAACFRRALELDPDLAEAFYNLGNVLQLQEKPNEAIAYYHRALELKPAYAEAHYNLGNALHGQGSLAEAIASYRRALELKPNYAAAYRNLGHAFRSLGDLDEAADYFRRAFELQPLDAAALQNLGDVRQAQGKSEEAIACYRRVLELKPDDAEAHLHLGNSFRVQGKPHEAAACFRRALELQPDYAAAHVKLGNVRLLQGNSDEAVACFCRALEIEPNQVDAHFGLGNAYFVQGSVNDAVASYHRALELKREFAAAHSALLCTLYFHPDYDALAICEEHRRWNQRFAEPLAAHIRPHLNDRSPDRRLRIGYVSLGFRADSTGVSLLPLLEAHDHERFEIFCYAAVRAPDSITDRCRAHSDAWRNALDISDERFAQLVHNDEVDILVDLTMHLAYNRLLAFARKPAPVQVTYLAYAGTTGLSAMDYRLTDPYLDPPGRLGPPGKNESVYSEQSIRLPETFWCYRPLIDTPPVNSLPAIEAGHVTFGCLNNFCKATEPSLLVWIGLLQALPGAQLLLHAHAGSHRDRVRDLFAQHGVSPERVMFADLLPMPEYFELYHRFDVALDPFPYGGGTTTCDALWMGVPVVSLAGQTAVGRGGLSILSNVGLPELVARDTDEYIRIAVELASDLPRLGNLRATLRERMQNSPLMDAPRFARNVEAAYREMWRRWCER